MKARRCHFHVNTGWWFGTMEFDDVPIILGMSSSQLTHIFQRGRAQPPSSVARSCYCSWGFPEGFPAKKTWQFSQLPEGKNRSW